MFGRRIVEDADSPRVARDPGDDRGEDGRVEGPVRRRKGDVGRAAVRILEEFAGVLLRRPR